MTNDCIDIVNEPVDFDKNVIEYFFVLKYMIVALISFYFYAMVL